MKKIFSLLTILALTLVFPLSASAQVSGTFVQGFVYDTTHSNAPVANANVFVTCNSTTHSVTTNGAGKYASTFSLAECNDGDPIHVSANKNNLSGNGSGTVSNVVTNINVGVVNVFVSSVPEFGMLTGALALLTTGGSYFALKRKRFI